MTYTTEEKNELVAYILDNQTNVIDKDIDDVLAEFNLGKEQEALDLLNLILKGNLNIITPIMKGVEKILDHDLKQWKKVTPIDDQIEHIADYCELVEETLVTGTSATQIEGYIPPKLRTPRMSKEEAEIADILEKESMEKVDDYIPPFDEKDRIVPPIDRERVLSGREFEEIYKATAEEFLENYWDISVYGVYIKDDKEEMEKITYASECSLEKYIKFVYHEVTRK